MVDVARGHLVFAVGASLYAVPAETAAEVVTMPAVTRVPGAPPHVLGVFAHRGEVLPVIDLGLLTGAPPSDGRRAVLVRGAGQAVALLADKVHGVSVLSGVEARVGDVGVQAHFRGPGRGPAGDAVVIEPEGFIGFLGRS